MRHDVHSRIGASCDNRILCSTLFLMRLCRFWLASFLLSCAAWMVRGWWQPVCQQGRMISSAGPDGDATSENETCHRTHLAGLLGWWRWSAGLAAICRTGRKRL